LQETAQTLIDEFHGEGIRQYIEFGFLKEGEHHFACHFMPYRDLYLKSDKLEGSYEERGNMNSIYILSSIAVLILLIACFNYMMISIGAALNRIGDFGMMIVVGARRWQVLAQFVVESSLLTIVSLFLGIVLAEQLLPLFNTLAEDDLTFTLYSKGINFLFLFAVLFFIVFSTSTYIGFYLLRRSHPLRLLRKEMLSVRRNGIARVSVVLQFFIAIILLISGALIMKQLNFLVNQDVGFEKENTAVVHVDFELQKILTLKELILESPNVDNVTMSDRNFTSGSSSQALKNKRGEITQVRFLRTDSDYLKTLNLELIGGNNFNRDVTNDTIPGVIVNETLLKELDMEDPIGERVSLDSDGTVVDIIGVIKDFHFDSMHDEIEPLILHNFSYNSIWYMFIKARDGQMAAALEHSKKVWKEIAPEIT